MEHLDLAQEAEEIRDRLTRAGIRAAIDARDLNPPCVQVRTPTLTFRFGRGWNADWELWLLAPDSGHTRAMRVLGELLSRVVVALDFTITTARPDSTLLADGSTVPALTLSFTTRINPKEAPHA